MFGVEADPAPKLNDGVPPKPNVGALDPNDGGVPVDEGANEKPLVVVAAAGAGADV